jgi:hypothetical protein
MSSVVTDDLELVLDIHGMITTIKVEGRSRSFNERFHKFIPGANAGPYIFMVGNEGKPIEFTTSNVSIVEGPLLTFVHSTLRRPA